MSFELTPPQRHQAAVWAALLDAVLTLRWGNIVLLLVVLLYSGWNGWLVVWLPLSAGAAYAQLRLTFDARLLALWADNALSPGETDTALGALGVGSPQQRGRDWTSRLAGVRRWLWRWLGWSALQWGMGLWLLATAV